MAPGKHWSQSSIVPLAHTVTERVLNLKPTVIANGFRSGDIFPWDPSAPTQARTDPSQIYLQTDSSNEQGLSGSKTVIDSNDASFIENPMEGSSHSLNLMEGSSHASNSEEYSSRTTCLDLESFNLPNSNQRFLARFELLLSEAELNTFNHLYSSGNFTEPNLPYQSWLVLKRGLEPVVEQEALEQVLVSKTPKKIMKRQKRVGPKQPDGPPRYV